MTTQPGHAVDRLPAPRPLTDESSAQSAISLLGRFTASLVHDLRSPLTVIHNSVHFLRGAIPQTSKVTDLLDMIDSEARELNNILTRLLEISHDWVPEPASVELEPLLTELIAELDRGREARWRFDFRYQPTVIWCDRNRMKQVLAQLLSNSLSAMKGSGELFISAWQEADGDVIEVRDCGPGIPPELKETLFDPFVTTKRSGMGLGLTYCRSVVQRHRGRIGLVDQSSAGAVFRITLPREGPTAVPPKASKPVN